MKFTLGFSPCPNDTFIFDALVNKKIETGNFRFEPVMEDVQTLNRWALEGKLDITKISYGVLPLVLGEYSLLNSGSALGRGVGPLLIAQNSIAAQEVDEKLIAIPGENTTAHLLFSLAYPAAKKKVFLRYDEIEDFVMSGKGLGVIIHENRFTYAEKGLTKLIDLGEYWESVTNNAIPLGGIVIRRSLPKELHAEVDSLIRKSVEFAFQQYPALSDFTKAHAQEMSEAVMRQHINLYVNEYSLDLADAGRSAVSKLMEVYRSVNDGNTEQQLVFGR